MFEAAYPNRRMGSCTIAVFEALVAAARRNIAFLHNNYTEDLQRQDAVDRGNREIVIQRRFPTYFPEPDLG